jgi:RNA polymerase sigma-70 factor (ECF subfamily)
VRVSQATNILSRIQRVDDAAAAELLPLVYDELRQLAARYMDRARAGHTLQPTALIHEAYLKLISGEQAFNSRAHFIGVAAHAMRQVLVDHARRRQADKRGGDWVRVTLDHADPSATVSCDEVLALHEAMDRLAAKQERLAHVVELRYFGGLTIKETAVVVGVSHTTVEDDWSLAKAWLARELDGGA